MRLETIVGGYLRGQVITSLAIGIFTFGLLSVTRVPNAIALAAFAALTDVIPFDDLDGQRVAGRSDGEALQRCRLPGVGGVVGLGALGRLGEKIAEKSPSAGTKVELVGHVGYLELSCRARILRRYWSSGRRGRARAPRACVRGGAKFVSWPDSRGGILLRRMDVSARMLAFAGENDTPVVACRLSYGGARALMRYGVR